MKWLLPLSERAFCVEIGSSSQVSPSLLPTAPQSSLVLGCVGAAVHRPYASGPSQLVRSGAGELRSKDGCTEWFSLPCARGHISAFDRWLLLK